MMQLRPAARTVPALSLLPATKVKVAADESAKVTGRSLIEVHDPSVSVCVCMNVCSVPADGASP